MKEYTLISHGTGSCGSGIIELPVHQYSRKDFRVGQKLKIKAIHQDTKHLARSRVIMNCRVCAITDYLVCFEKLNKFGQAIYRVCFKYVDFDKTGTVEVME